MWLPFVFLYWLQVRVSYPIELVPYLSSQWLDSINYLSVKLRCHCGLIRLSPSSVCWRLPHAILWNLERVFCFWKLCANGLVSISKLTIDQMPRPISQACWEGGRLLLPSALLKESQWLLSGYSILRTLERFQLTNIESVLIKGSLGTGDTSPSVLRTE